MGRLNPTAVLLTIFVVGVSALLLSDGGEPDRGMVLRLGLRDLVSSVEAAGAVSTDLELDLPHAVAGVVDASPATDPTWIAAGAVLVAYGHDDAAGEWLDRVRVPTVASELIQRLRQTERAPDVDVPTGADTAAAPQVPPPSVTGALTPPEDGTRTALEPVTPLGATPVAGDAGSPSGEVTRTSTDLQDDLDTIRAMGDVPPLARERLAVRVLRDGGDPERADATAAAAERDRDRMLLRLGGVAGVLLLSGLIGLGLWLFSRRVRARLARRFDGLSGGLPFVFPGSSIYMALVGWFAFHLAISILLPMALMPTGLLEAEPALPIALATTASGLFGLVIVQHMIGSAPLLETLGIHVRPFSGGIPHAAAWGWLFYCASLPAWMSAALVNNSLVSDETVVSNPVIPLLTEASGPAGFSLLLLSVAVLAPLFEEAFFRGFLYRAIRDRLGVGAAVALSAAAFALVHLSFQTMLPLFALGCVLALAYEWTGSLVPSIVLHSINNLISVALVLATMS